MFMLSKLTLFSECYNPYCSDKDYFKHVYTLILTVYVD